MARNTEISVKDRALVKKHLIQGYSLTKSLEGTNIKSPNTARKILLEDMQDIARRRKSYVNLIEAFGATEYDRAEQWATMTQAKRAVGKGEEMVLIPDWKSRHDALKYIDTLSGFYEEKGPDFKAEVHLDNRRMYVVLPPERQRNASGGEGSDLLEAASGEADGSPNPHRV